MTHINSWNCPLSKQQRTDDGPGAKKGIHIGKHVICPASSGANHSFEWSPHPAEAFYWGPRVARSSPECLPKAQSVGSAASLSVSDESPGGRPNSSRSNRNSSLRSESVSPSSLSCGPSPASFSSGVAVSRIRCRISSPISMILSGVNSSAISPSPFNSNVCCRPIM